MLQDTPKGVDMEETSRTSSRRGLFGRGLVLAAGALGITAARRPATAQASVPNAAGSELRFYGRNFHLHAPARVAGQVPERGDRHSAYGELLDRPKGKVVGQFTAAYLTQESPFAGGASSLEIHTFALDGGTIHGLGSAARGAEGHFVILGGTGRYAGVQGSYVASQRSRELGGNGTAEFRLSLAGKETAHV
jgi:hypothetical protein